MSKPTKNTQAIRRSLELQPKTAERLERLKDALEATSDTEVIRRALQVLESLLIDEAKGSKFFVRDIDGNTTAVSIRYSGIANNLSEIMHSEPPPQIQ